jgi:hypothetical protein
MLDQDKREELADIYSQIQQGNRKWRIRQIIAGQIGLLSKLFLEETIVKIIIPISFQLCKDDVSSVREAACEQIASLLKNNKGRALCELLIVENIKSFASYNRFTLRQSFISMCDGLLDDFPFFQANFLSLFEKLADDKVSNVRIGLAKVLVRHFDRKSAASRDDAITRIYKKLTKDAAGDVVKILKKEHTIIDEVVSSSSDDHNASRTISEDFHSEDRKHEEEELLQRIDDVKAHSNELAEDLKNQEEEEKKEDLQSPLLESDKEHIPPKKVQDEIEKLVETKQVEETLLVKEAIEEAKQQQEKHDHRLHDHKVDPAEGHAGDENTQAKKDEESPAKITPEEVVHEKLTDFSPKDTSKDTNVDAKTEDNPTPTQEPAEGVIIKEQQAETQ